MTHERLSIQDQQRANVLGKYLDVELERYWNGIGRDNFHQRRKEQGHLEILSAVKSKALRDLGQELTDHQAFENFLDWYAVNQQRRTKISLAFGELYGAGDV